MGIKQPFDGKMIGISNYSLDQYTSKSNTQGELPICYQTTTTFLCICESHKLGTPNCTCDRGFYEANETTIISCGISGGGTTDPTGDPNNGGGSGNPDGSTFNPDFPVFDDPNYINKLKTNYFWEAIGDAKRIWVNSNFTTQEIYKRLIDYQIEQKWSILSREYSIWSIDFFQVNQNITWDQFENWFMGTPEGQDGEYDTAFWENPNLTFQQQNLPTLAAFKSSMPSKYTDAGTLCNSLGGDVLKMYNDVIAKGKKLNTCAIRVSTALIKCDVSIPFIPDNPNGSKNTVKDKDGNYLIINAKALNKWMRKTFGTNTANYRHFTAVQGGVKGGNFPQLMEDIGSDGIYSMVSRPEIHGTWGTGHADILEEGDCRIKCHFFDEKNNFVPVDYIDVWILK